MIFSFFANIHFLPVKIRASLNFLQKVFHPVSFGSLFHILYRRTVPAAWRPETVMPLLTASGLRTIILRYDLFFFVGNGALFFGIGEDAPDNNKFYSTHCFKNEYLCRAITG